MQKIGMFFLPSSSQCEGDSSKISSANYILNAGFSFEQREGCHNYIRSERLSRTLFEKKELSLVLVARASFGNYNFEF